MVIEEEESVFPFGKKYMSKYVIVSANIIHMLKYFSVEVENENSKNLIILDVYKVSCVDLNCVKPTWKKQCQRLRYQINLFLPGDVRFVSLLQHVSITQSNLPGEFLGKNETCKTTPQWKWFEMSTSPIYIAQFSSRSENFQSLIFHDNFSNLTSINFSFNPVLLLGYFLVPGRVSSRLRESNVVFFAESRVKFYGHKRLTFICFYRIFMMNRKLDFVYLKISLNEFKKLIKLSKPQVCLCTRIAL